MEDENLQPVPQATPTAAEIAREVMALQPRQQSPQQQPQLFDAIAATAQKLKDEGYPDDYIRGNLLATQATRFEMDQKLSLLRDNIRSEVGMENQHRDAAKAVRDALSPYMSDPLIKKAAVAINAEITQKFNSDPTLVAKWNNRIVDHEAIEKIADSVVEDFYKAAGKESVKRPLSPQTKSASNVLSMQPKKIESEDDLDENQQELYNAYTSTMMAVSREKPEEIRKKGLALAMKAPTPPKSRAVKSNTFRF